MRFELQRADFWKRISAFLFDIIMLITLAVGISAILSAVLKYDSYYENYDRIREEYYERYNIDPEISEDELTEEQKQTYEIANKEFSTDPDAAYNHVMLLNLSLIILSFSVLISYIALELVIPYVFKYGRTLGKRIFGLAVMRTNGVKVSNQAFFIRTIIGKYTMETMVPIYLFIMTVFGSIALIGPVLIFLLLALNVFTVFYTKTRSTIHDLVSDTVVVDMASQMIFESEEDLIAYKTRIHQEEANRQEY